MCTPTLKPMAARDPETCDGHPNLPDLDGEFRSEKWDLGNPSSPQKTSWSPKHSGA